MAFDKRDRRTPAGLDLGPENTGATKQRATGIGSSTALAEPPDFSREASYWRDNFGSRPYARKEWRYEDIEPAYRFGWESRARFEGRSFDEASPELERDWAGRTTAPGMSWASVKEAVRDAWHHVEAALPGDADGDGR